MTSSFRLSTHLPVLAFALVALVATGCGKKDSPRTTPSASQVTPQVEPPPPAPPLPPPIRPVSPTSSGGRSNAVRVIDSGDPNEGRQTTLVEASRMAKAQKRNETRTPIAEINDENLAEYAEGGEVIVLESEPAAPYQDEAPAPTAASDLGSGDIRDEEYWRNRALELRMSWRRSIDEIGELELESAALRQQFYAEEDPYIRDSQIKPAWDRTLDRLNALREQTSRYQRELDNFLQEGRQAGALQGWLNQGWELEPSAEERRMVERTRTTEPGEPESREPEEIGGDPSREGGS